jgi:hypothetical protein
MAMQETGDKYYNDKDFIDSWDEPSKEVFRKMDAFDATFDIEREDLSKIISAGAKVFTNIETVADNILNSAAEEREKHLEVLLLIMAFTPSINALTYLKEMTQKRPDIYRVFFGAVIKQEPLRDTGKLIRKRISVALKRSSIVEEIYSVEVSQSLASALESYKRRR